MKYWLEENEFTGKEEAKVKAKLKSEEEIAQFTIDDKLPPAKVALLLLTSLHRDQRQAVLRNLEMYLDDSTALSSIMPKLCDCIMSWPTAEQAPLADAVLRLFKKKVIPSELAERVMPVIFKAIDDGNEETVLVWHPVFCAGVPLVGWKHYLDRYWPLILKMADLSHTVVSRRAAANIIAATINEAAENHLVNDGLLHAFLSLCQDTDLTIRRAMLNNYHLLLPIMKDPYSEAQLFSEDMNTSLRLLVIEIIITHFKRFEEERVTNEFLPLLLKEINQCIDFTGSWVLDNFSAIVSFFLSLKCLSDSHVESLDHFLHRAILSDEIEVRKIAVKSIHSLAKLYLSRGVDLKYEYEINQKAQDPVYLPIIARVFPDIMTVFSTYHKGDQIRPAFLNVFTSDSKEDFKNVVTFLPEMLPHLLPKQTFEAEHEENQKKQEDDQRFKVAIMKRIKEIWGMYEKGPWRDFAGLIEVVAGIQAHFSIVEFNAYYLDKLWEVFRNGNNEIKRVSIQSICKLLTYNHYSLKRKEVFEKITDLASSASFYDRRQFLFFCGFAVGHFAQSLLAELEVFQRYLRLAEDKVANIRLGFARNSIKVWTYSTRSKFRKDLLAALSGLKGDKNREVKAVAEKAYCFLVENSDEIAKGDCLRETQNEDKEAKEKELCEKEEEEEEEKKEREAQQAKELKAQAAAKKVIKGLSVKQPKELVLKVPQKQAGLKKKVSTSMLTGKTNGTMKKRVALRAGKDTLLKMHTMEPLEPNTTSIKIKGTGLGTGKYKLSSKLSKKKQ